MPDVDLETRAYAVIMARRYFDGTLTKAPAGVVPDAGAVKLKGTSAQVT